MASGVRSSLRDPELLTPAYVQVLTHRRAARVYNAWRAMPSIAEQAAVITVTDRPFALVRLMLPPGGDYEARKRDLAPFATVRDPQPAILDDAVAVVRTALGAGRAAFVLASNKLEGCAPETVRSLALRLAVQPADGTPSDES